MRARILLAAALAVSVVALILHARRGRSGLAHFRPVPVPPCRGAGVGELRLPLDTDGTVVWEPYSMQTRVSLGRGAESPLAAEGPAPYVGTGRVGRTKRYGDRYRGTAALQRLTSFELQPGRQGFLERETFGGEALARDPSDAVLRPRPLAGAHPASGMPDIDTDVDISAFTGALHGGLHEGLTSRRHNPANSLTAARTGLGSIRLDPRFEPGPLERLAGGDASPSHGGHAGGPTLGGFGAARFPVAGAWDWNYVHGFAEHGLEAVETGRSLL